ncbi:MAG: PqqD family protein [Candidatus Krumholzibacteriia bacterium]
MRLPTWLGRRSRWEGVDFLTLVPEHAVDWEEDGRGRVLLLMPRFSGTFYHRILQPLLKGPRRFIKVPLEARGDFIWRRIDGRTPARELVEAFVAAFPAEQQPADRVCQYLYHLERNGFVRFVNLPE